MDSREAGWGLIAQEVRWGSESYIQETDTDTELIMTAILGLQSETKRSGDCAPRGMRYNTY